MTKENIVYVDKETMEIKAERTEFSKTFYVTDTERKLVSSRSPIHVKDKKGNWVDITCEIKGNKPINCPYKASMLKDKVGYQMQQEGENGKFFVEIEILDVPYKKPEVEGNTAVWKDITPNVDVVMSFTPNNVQFFRILKNKKSRKTFDYRLVLDEKKAEHIAFGGQDAEGNAVHLEQVEKSSTKIKRKGLNLVEKVITDTFMQEVTTMNEKTRKRSWSKKMTYPVVIH